MDGSSNPLNETRSHSTKQELHHTKKRYDTFVDVRSQKAKKLCLQKLREPRVLSSTNLIFFKISDYIDFNGTSNERCMWMFRGLDSFCDVFVALIILISQIVILFNVYHESKQKCDDDHPSKILWMGAILCSLYAGCVSTEAFLLALPYEIYGTDPKQAQELVMRVNESVDNALRESRNSLGPGIAPDVTPHTGRLGLFQRSQSARTVMGRDVIESPLTTIPEVRSMDEVIEPDKVLTAAAPSEDLRPRRSGIITCTNGEGEQVFTDPIAESNEGAFHYLMDNFLDSALGYFSDNSDWLTDLLEETEVDGAMTRAVSKAYLYVVAATLQLSNILLLLVVATVMGNASSFTDLISKFISVEIVIHVHEIVPRVLKITDKSPAMYNKSGITLEQELEIKGILKSGCMVPPAADGTGGVYRQSSKSKKNFIFWVFFVLVYFWFLMTTFACHEKKYVGL